MCDRTYFYRLQAQVFWVRRRCSTISINAYLRDLLFVLVIYTLFGASALQSVKLPRSLGDAAVQHSMLESPILIFSKGLRSYRTSQNRIRKESVICITSIILLSNHYKFNSLTSYELSHFKLQ